MTASDSTLLSQYARADDQAAFAELVSRHADWVYSASTRLVRDCHLAQDVTQAVFLLLAQNAAAIADRPVNAWLFKTTRYCAANALRADRRRRRHERNAAMLKRDSSDADPQPLWEQIAPLLEQSVGRLRDGDRRALLLCFYQRKSMAEVGAALGVSEDAAKKRVAAAIERLRLQFVDKGVLIPTVAIIAAMLAEKTAHAAPAGLAASCIPGAASVSAAQIAQGVHRMLFLTKLKLVIAAVLFLLGIPASFWLIARAAAPPPLSPVASAISQPRPPATQADNAVVDDTAISAFCNAQTQVVVSLHFGAIDPDAIADALQTCLLENADPNDAARRQYILATASGMRANLKHWLDDLSEAGCPREYLLAEQRGPNPRNIVGMFAVPIGPQSDVMSLDTIFGQRNDGVDSPDGHARAYGAKPDVTALTLANEDRTLPNALSAAGDAAVRVAFHPAVLTFIQPLPAAMGLGDLSDPQWSSVIWGCTCVVGPPNLSDTVILQCKDADSANALAKLLQAKFVALKDSPPVPPHNGKGAAAVEELMKQLGPLLAQVEPAVSGNRVMLSFDKDITGKLLMVWYHSFMEPGPR
jgi:RNA polymerase sigma factor (sigma-70 family)